MRIHIVSPRAAALCQLFPQSGNHFSLCVSLHRMQESILSSVPQLVLLDEDINVENHINTLENVKTVLPQATYMILMTRKVDLSEVCQCMMADAFVRPQADAEVIGAVLNAYQMREPYLSPRILDSLPFMLILRDQLSRRERQVLDMIAKRFSSKEVAAFLSLSEETVQNHRKSIKNKLGLRGGKTILLNYTKLYNLVEKMILKE